MKRVMVTGATGFIGGRLVEALVEREVEVVCLVRRWGSASRLARHGVQMVAGDVLDAASVKRAMSGCDIVVHAAIDSRIHGRAHSQASAEGARVVMQSALEQGVSRVVHLSSTAVFGLSPARGTNTDEQQPLRRVGHDYCDGKIAAERVVAGFHARHALPVAVLRPTLVYGPFGYYSSAVARAARERRLVLLDGATGVCNGVYIDNLIQAILLAAERDAAIGSVCTVSDAHPVTWRAFLEAHAAAVDPSLVPLPVVTRADVVENRRRLRRAAIRGLFRASAGQAVRQLRDPAIKHGLLAVPGLEWSANTAKAILGRLPARAQARVRGALASAKDESHQVGAGRGRAQRMLSSAELMSFSAFEHVTFSIAHAQRVLGYAPAISFDEGMSLTAAWIRWAGI